MRIVPSAGTEYRRLEARLAGRAQLLSRFPEPDPDRFAFVYRTIESPGSVAIARFVRAGSPLRRELELYLVDRIGQSYDGDLSDLTGERVAVHVELIESFDRNRGYAGALLDGISDEHAMVFSSVPDAVPFYARRGFTATGVYDGLEDRPILVRTPRA